MAYTEVGLPSDENPNGWGGISPSFWVIKANLNNELLVKENAVFLNKKQFFLVFSGSAKPNGTNRTNRLFRIISRLI